MNERLATVFERLSAFEESRDELRGRWRLRGFRWWLLICGNAESFEERERLARVESGFSRMTSLLAEPVSLAATLDAVAQLPARTAAGA